MVRTSRRRGVVRRHHDRGGRLGTGSLVREYVGTNPPHGRIRALASATSEGWTVAVNAIHLQQQDLSDGTWHTVLTDGDYDGLHVDSDYGETGDWLCDDTWYRVSYHWSAQDRITRATASGDEVSLMVVCAS